MKHAFPTVLATSLALIAILPGCHKTAAPGTPPNPETAKTFDAVGRHLDPGGDIYLYLRTEQILAKLPAKLDEWKASLEASMGASVPMPKKDVDDYYAVLRKALVDSGLTQVRAYGFSAVELPGGLSRMKSILYSGELESPGMIWKLSGSQGEHPLATLDFVPTDAVYASFADFDPAVLWNYLMDAANGISDPKIQQQVKSLPAMMQMIVGMAPKDLFASLGSEWGLVITADPTKTMQWPGEKNAGELPLIRIAVLLRVKDDKIHDLIVSRLQAAIGQMMPVKTTTEDGVKMTTVTVPDMHLPLAPTIARFGDYLAIASTPEIVQELARKGANPPALMKDTEEFKKLSAGETLEGNAYAYLSERGSKILRDIQIKSGGNDSMPPAMKEQMAKFYGAFSQRSLFSIARVEKDGCTSTMISPDGSKKILAAFAIVPAVAAAVALPAIVKAQQAAKSARSHGMHGTPPTPPSAVPPAQTPIAPPPPPAPMPE